jgi:hypothetical protein
MISVLHDGIQPGTLIDTNQEVILDCVMHAGCEVQLWVIYGRVIVSHLHQSDTNIHN